MTIIKIAPEWNNSHCSLDNVDYILPNWVELPTEFAETWEQFAPFVNIEVDENGVIVGMTETEEIIAEDAEPTETTTTEDLVSAIEEGLNYE